MSSPPRDGSSNGQRSPRSPSMSPKVASRRSSLSEHSDDQGALPIAASPTPSPDPDDETIYINGGHDFAESSNSPDQNNASDDGDFDMDDDVLNAQSDGGDVAADARSSSGDSNQSLKRKANQNEDHFIKANPELYGLRRSTRPTQQRKVVDSDSASDSDVVPANRRTTKRRRIEVSQRSSKRTTPAPRQASPEESDSDAYGGARGKTFRKKARREREAQPETAFTEKRWSSRRAAQQVQQGAYEESDAETDEDLLNPDYDHQPAVEDNSPYVDKVLRHRLKDGMELGFGSNRNDFEYYIKWQGKSHLHDTWETTDTLRHIRGFRKLENYYRTVVEHELLIRFGEDVPPETKEQFFLDRERAEEALEDFKQVERVTAVRDGEEDTEYLIKWKGCYYEENTWEAAPLVAPNFQDKIDAFLNRSSRQWISDRKEANPDTRTRMTKLEKQPEYIVNGELREFQLRGLNFLCLNWTRANNVILADEMGLGKTVQSVSFLSWLRNDRAQEGPFLIVAPLSVIPAWGDTFDNWSPDMNYVNYLGNETSRSMIREHELLTNGNTKKPKFNALITSYEMILQDWQFLQTIKWQALLVDEAHRLKNKESQLYARLFAFGVPCKILITGTPIQNNLAELSALMDFLNPGKVVIDEELENLTGADTQEKLADLHKSIAPYILRRTKETVESDLPPKTEKIIRVELSDVQLEYYKNILTRNYAALSDATGQKNSLLNIMMELKKASNHPYMFPGAEDRVLAGSVRREDQIKGLIASSGKMMLLDQLLTKLRKDGHRVLIFSQMVKMLDILSDYLALRGYKFQRLDGTIAAGPRRMAINHFNAEDSDDFCFLLSTRAGGLGINLMTADTVVIFDSDWNPQADLQAMGRAHRIGQKKPVSIYRLVSKETVEEEVLERARNKLLLEYLTIQAGVTDEGNAFREEFSKKGLKVDGPSSSEDIQWILKMRSQKMFEQTGNQERLEQLDIDSILENAEVTKTKVDDKMNLSSGGIDWDNFMQYTDVKVDDLTLDWDQIIPAEELAVIKADEEKKKHDDYLAKVAAESAPRRAAMKNRHNGDDRADRLAKKREREEQQRHEAEEKRALLSDPKRPLNEKETRNLLKAFFRFGALEDREDEIVHEARLDDRDRSLLRSVLGEFISICDQAMDENNARLVEDERKSGKLLTKKDRKAVLVDFGEVRKMNAETAIERPKQLRLLRDVLGKASDPKSFRLHDASKAAHYTCEWGAKEDGMLLVGISRYGFGAWTQIRDDPDLGMKDKFFLEEHRVEKKEERNKGADKAAINSPGAVHLVRRSEYLLSVLQSRYSLDAAAQRAVDNHHRNNKKHLGNGHRRSDVGSANASPAPQLAKKNSHRDHNRSRSGVDDKGTPRPDSKRKHSGHDEGRIPKIRRVEDARHSRSHGDDRDTPRTEKKRSKEDGGEKHSHKTKKHDESRQKDDRRKSHDNHGDRERRQQALARLAELRQMGDSSEMRDQNPDAMLWYLLKPVRQNFETILETTKEKVKSSKERARIFGDELVVIGTFLDREFVRESDMPLKNRFWEFLATLWPVDNTNNPVTADRLSFLYRTIRDREKKEETSRTAANGTSAAS